MEYPAYCIVFGRAVKAVRTPEGGLELLVYSPATDEFEPAAGFVHQFFCGEETEWISEAEFETHVVRQRAAWR